MKHNSLAQQQACLFSSLPFATDVLEEALLVVLDTSCHVQFQGDLNLPYCIPE